jgi:hypothetical protein
VGFDNASEKGELQSNKTPSFTVASIPMAYRESYLKCLNQNSGRLWTVRSPYQINQQEQGGTVFEVGNCVVRIGEIRVAGHASPRALLVAIEMPYEADDGSWNTDDEDAIKAIIKEILTTLGFESGKEAWGFGSEDTIVRAWCEILKT